MKSTNEQIAAECRYCGDDAVGMDALGRYACERHIEEIADDLSSQARAGMSYRCRECEALVAYAGELPKDCIRCGALLACPKCRQVDLGQTGEYLCSTCGLPTTWDEPVAGHEHTASADVAECECGSGLPAEFWTGEGWMCGECYDEREERAELERG